MTSFSAAGESSISTSLYFQVPTPITDPPTANSPGTSSAPGPPLATLTPTFNWNPLNAASGYGLYIFDITSSTFLFQNVGGQKVGTSYMLPNGYLTNNGHAYRWYMTSFSAAGESASGPSLYFQAPTAASPTPTPTPTPTINPGGPIINLITPNSVVGSSTTQAFTINGSNFTSQSVVYLGFKDNNYSQTATARTPIFNSSNQLTITITVGLLGDTWKVWVKNGTVYSNEGNFAVSSSSSTPLPSVQTLAVVSPGSTSAVINGTSTSSSLAIDDRRFDWGPTQPLANAVYTQSIAVNGNNFSATLTGLSPNTTYSFRAWSHNGSATNIGYGAGWNTGTILSFTTAAAAGAALPVITSQPADATIPTNGSVTLTVAATGGQPTFQWYRDGSLVVGSTRSSITVWQPGTYWAIANNSAGAVTSRHSTVSGTTSVPPTPQPSPGAARWRGSIDLNRPSFVITHGWQRGETYTEGATPQWVVDMVDAIYNRVGERANIIYFVWPEAYAGKYDPFLPYSHAHGAGLKLQSELRRILGASYSQNIHFIGHSFGTIVTAYAIENYHPLGVAQFTILDAALKWTPNNGTFFLQHVPSPVSTTSGVNWVENYIATSGGELDHFGDVVPGTAKDDGFLLAETHEGTHDWFTRTISSSASTEGFYNSCFRLIRLEQQSHP